ncbi:1-deoxy-D-xylulose-5-phosphate reductoisomerase [Streptomyces parvus]|uniref:1-deoxy-D-xylulose-5-phosphate reductoisomerase n=1 Tax=Streptomyces parvus TaxID=66428 RepID=UPI0035E33731
MTANNTDVSNVVILGSTGSIGTQAIDVIRRAPDRFRVKALSAGGGNLGLLAEQALELRVETVAVASSSAEAELVERLKTEAGNRGRGALPLPEVISGPEANTHLASLPCDSVLNGITGAVGLAPTLAALDAGSRLILANKESLIVGGPLVKQRAKPGQIIPVDSEHSALFQCLQGDKKEAVHRLVLTASGGPFRGRTRAQMADVTCEEALAHPIWAMGPVNTINSANLVNKGLEAIEAHLLFDVPYDRIDVVIHPQVMVHSMVEFIDGSTLAQVSPPDMRLPLSLGLGWPDRVPDAAPRCDWTKAATWEFHPVDDEAFPAVRLASRVGELGGTMPAVFNAANEECVAAFAAGRIPFLSIVDILARLVDEHDHVSSEDVTLQAIAEAEQWARARAHELTGAS